MHGYIYLLMPISISQNWLLFIYIINRKMWLILKYMRFFIG